MRPGRAAWTVAGEGTPTAADDAPAAPGRAEIEDFLFDEAALLDDWR
jgi:hypothetical protein